MENEYKGELWEERGYPERPLTLVVPWAAGGSTDVIASAICKVAEKEFGQPIIVENKAGVSGVIGMNYILKSPPDGYTVVMTTTSSYIWANLLKKEHSFISC